MTLYSRHVLLSDGDLTDVDDAVSSLSSIDLADPGDGTTEDAHLMEEQENRLREH